MNCEERDKLKAHAMQTLRDIMEFTDRLIHALDGGRMGSLTPLDKDLEMAVGSKERAFGALNQHCRDHKCGDSIPAERLPS